MNPLPVFPELRPVFAGPFEQQTHGAAGQTARSHFQCLETNHDFIFGIAGVKVRWLVIIPIHRNDYAEKLLSVGMGGMLFAQTGE